MTAAITISERSVGVRGTGSPTGPRRRARSRRGRAGGGVEDPSGRGGRGGARGGPAPVRRKPGARRRRTNTPRSRRPSRSAAASHRPAADQQGGRGGGAVRRDRDGGPAAPRRGAGAGDGAAGPPARPVHRGQYRRGAAKSRHRCPREADAFIAECRDGWHSAGGRADVHSARRREAGAAFRAVARDRAAPRADAAQHGHERRLRDRDPLRLDGVRLGTAIFGARGTPRLSRLALQPLHVLVAEKPKWWPISWIRTCRTTASSASPVSHQ